MRRRPLPGVLHPPRRVLGLALLRLVGTQALLLLEQRFQLLHSRQWVVPVLAAWRDARPRLRLTFRWCVRENLTLEAAELPTFSTDAFS